jgi:hypothetical protein
MTKARMGRLRVMFRLSASLEERLSAADVKVRIV